MKPYLQTINSKYNRNLRTSNNIRAFRLTETITFLPIGVKATGVKTKGNEYGSGFKQLLVGEGALCDKPKQWLCCGLNFSLV